MDGAAGDKPSAPGLEQVDPRPVLISSNSGMRPSGGEGLPHLSSKGMMQRTISLARTLTNDPREKARLQAQADTQQELAMQRRVRCAGAPAFTCRTYMLLSMCM